MKPGPFEIIRGDVEHIDESVLDAVRAELATARVLVTMGRPVVDVHLQVPVIPGPGQKTLTEGVNSTPGGVDGNFASSLASLGLQVRAIGSDSTDDVAEVDRKSLRDHGVDARWDEASAGPATICYVLVDEAGERAIVVSYPDDPVRIRDGILRGVREAAGQRWDLCYLAVLRTVHRDVLPLIRPISDIVAVTLEDSDWPRGWLDAAASQLNIVFVADETFEAREAKLRELQSAHGWTLVVTAGADGSFLVNPDGTVDRASATPLAGPVADTTGAGDAFASAFCAGYLAGLRGTTLLRVANWYAGHKVQAVGPRSFAPSEGFFRRVAAELQSGERTQPRPGYMEPHPGGNLQIQNERRTK